MTLEPGQVIENKYRIVRLLGQGGMGAVFEGENVRIRRRVAIKVLHAGFAEKADLVQRFEREAQAAGRIGSEHICEVLDLGILPGGERFMVMEYLEGEPLASRMQTCGQMLPAQIFPIVIEMLDGLGAAHEAGIVHRDLKPDNVFLLRNLAGRADFVKILDFGVSKFNPLGQQDDGMSMTQTGAVMGTPYYMSPEQAKGVKGIDHRSDLFSVGVILYEAVTGRVPFEAETFNELMFKIALEDPPPPETLTPQLDPGVGAIIRKALAREPAHRFPNAAAFARAMRDWMASGRVVSTPPPAGVALSQRGAQQMPPGTPAPWSSTGAGGASALPVKQSGAGLWVLVALGLLGLVGGGAAFFLTRGGVAATPAAGGEESAAETSDPEVSAPEASTAEPSAPLEDDPSADAPESDPESVEPDESGSATGSASATPVVAQPQKPPPASGPQGGGAKPPPSEAPPPPPSSGGNDTTDGRKIRTGL
jgi:eukaryotic-like serine/threonine-protein kinase